MQSSYRQNLHLASSTAIGMSIQLRRSYSMKDSDEISYTDSLSKSISLIKKDGKATPVSSYLIFLHCPEPLRHEKHHIHALAVQNNGVILCDL